MNPISASGATPPRCNGGPVLNNNRKRSRNEFEAGGLYQSELPLQHRPFGHRTQIHGHFNGLISQYESLNPPPLPHQLPQPLGHGVRQAYNNSILNPRPLPQQQTSFLLHQQPQPPLSHGVRQAYNNSILNPRPLPQQQPSFLPHQQPQPPLGHGVRQPYNNSILNPPPLPQQQPQPLGHSVRQPYNNSILNPRPLPQQQPQPLGHSVRQPYNNSILNPPLLPHQQPSFLPHQQPQPLGHGGPLPLYSNSSILNPPYKPQQPWGHDFVQQDNNTYLPGSSGGLNIPLPGGQLLEEQDHHLGLHAPPFNELQINPVAAVLDQQPHVQDNQPKALDKGDIVDWGHLWNLQVLLEDPDLIDEIDEYYGFQDWDPLEDDQSDGDQSDGDLSQDGEDGLLADDNFQGIQHGNGVPQQPIPAVINNPNLKICDEPGCIQPTFHQTAKARKCRLHLENPPPQSRLQAPGQAATAGQDFCSGCNGLHPRRAPGRTCWECYCKGRGRRLGVCDGCPASRCPNRVVEGA